MIPKRAFANQKVHSRKYLIWIVVFHELRSMLQSGPSKYFVSGKNQETGDQIPVGALT